MSGPDRSAIRPLRGAVAGGGAFLAGYALLYAWLAPEIRDALRALNTLLEILGGAPVPPWKAVAWVFYNAHFVDLTYPALGGGRVARTLIGTGTIPTTLYLVPPVLLLAAGALVAWSVDVTDPLDGALAGGSIAAGYGPLAVVGLAIVPVTIAGARISPALVAGVLLAGIVYPQLLGGVGGALVTAAR